MKFDEISVYHIVVLYRSYVGEVLLPAPVPAASAVATENGRFIRAVRVLPMFTGW